jgi:ABC-type multidrug transport system ATPase subunit/CRP-like cAMP-binding protein
MAPPPGPASARATQRLAFPGPLVAGQAQEERLRRVPLFARATSAMLHDIALRMQPASFRAGETICRENDAADQFYLVEAGTLSVATRFGTSSREVARLGAGQFFGEVALLGGARRSATVSATTEAQIWALAVQSFSALMVADPLLAAAISAGAKDREQRSEPSAYEVQHRNLADLLQERAELRLGSDRSNDIVLDGPRVSPFHAVVRKDGTGYQLSDLASSVGTFVNGARVGTTVLKDGDEIWIGHVRFVFDAAELAQISESRGVRIDASGLCRDVKGGKRILHDVGLTILPGELVALVGGSGAGKSTLLDALSGVRPATSGQVLYDGRDYYANLPLYRKALGYVPQDDIIHTDLPLRRTLLHAARLRLPPGTSKAQLDSRVDSALEQLGLIGQADTKVSSVSGGQRKRCSIGVELLTQPSVFFLDEPTSGLDPATDAQMMRLLRSLADAGDTVLVTTHATKNVMLCDKVVFLARGGHLAFVGPPAQALVYFQTESFDEIYERIADEELPAVWAERFQASMASEQVRQQALSGASSALGSGSPPSGGRGPWRALRESVHQYRVLSAREADINFHSKAVLAPLVAQPIIMTVLLLALFPSGVFGDADNLSRPLQLVLLLTFTSYIVGLLSSVLSIVKEAPIFLRERLVGIGVTPYVLSKVTFLGPAVLVRAVFMVLVLRLTNRLPSASWSFYWPLLVTTALVGLAAMTVGLMTSAVARTSQQATDFLSIWIMPQVLFSGALFAVPTMNIVGRWIADLTVTRWAFEAGANDTGLLALFHDAGTPAGESLRRQYASSFTLDRLGHWGVLLVFVIVPFVIARIVLGRRSAPR